MNCIGALILTDIDTRDWPSVALGQSSTILELLTLFVLSLLTANLLKVDLHGLEDSLASLLTETSLSCAWLHLVKEYIPKSAITMPIESFAAFSEYRRETLRGLLCRGLLLADKVHRRQLLLIIHDLHLLVISDIA